ncbi:hypothetical protein H4R35_007213 [Dimargaris xerosporica]|nr:hypothetical protein H4R35_007213 [Dimargaris xerosporica]
MREKDVQDINVGDHVEYRPVEGGANTTTGVVREIIEHREPAGETGVTVKASEEHPRFLIRNDKTGKETAYKPNVIERAWSG